MTSPRNSPIPTDIRQWMQRIEKIVGHEQRRPRVTKASDLLGPGFDAYAVEIRDWNSETARFNGFFYSPETAVNAPEPGMKFLGVVIGNREGHALQMVWTHSMGAASEQGYTRSMHTHANQMPVFTAWSPLGGQAVVRTGTIIDWSTLTAPAGYLACNGAVHQIATYPGLGALLGATYGGDGVTTFAVPTLSGLAAGMIRAIKT